MELVKRTKAPQVAHRGTNGRAEVTLKRAVRSARRTYGPQHVSVALSLIQLGDFLCCDQRFEEASSAFRQAASIYEELGVGHELLCAIALRSLGQCLFALGDYREATKVQTDANALIVDYQ